MCVCIFTGGLETNYTHIPRTYSQLKKHTRTYTRTNRTHDIPSSTHAQHQPPSYQSAKQPNSKRINTSETVEYALSKGTATEIGASNLINNYCRNGCSNNNNHSVSTSFEQSADSNTKIMSAEQNRRDRLGLWGNDSEVAASVSGLDRLRLSRYNKVRGQKKQPK